jgi:hypothetical protein
LAAGFDHVVRAQFFTGFFCDPAALQKTITAAEGAIAAIQWITRNRSNPASDFMPAMRLQR